MQLEPRPEPCQQQTDKHITFGPTNQLSSTLNRPTKSYSSLARPFTASLPDRLSLASLADYNSTLNAKVVETYAMIKALNKLTWFGMPKPHYAVSN